MVSYRLVVILHRLGASVWIGGHLVLCLAVLPRASRARDLVCGVGIRTGGLW